MAGITTFLDPAAMPNRSMDQQTFDNAMAALIAKLPTFGAEVNSTAANLNSVAAGGAYAIPFNFNSTGGSIGGSAGGRLTIPGSALTATQILLDTKSVAGTNIATTLTGMVSGNASAIKGQIRVAKQNDPASWAIYSVTDYVQNGGGLYGVFTVIPIAASSAVPFADGELLIMQFQRTGDKGDAGAMGTYQSAKFSDRKANGTAGGASSSVNVTQTRTLNTTDYNTITGASLSSNQVTLPAGTYDVFGRAPAVGVTAHRSALYNVTDSTYPLIGSSASTGSSTSNGISSDSVFTGRITLAAAKTFTIRHWTGSTGANTAELGQPSSGSGQLEVYTEVIFTKVA